MVSGGKANVMASGMRGTADAMRGDMQSNAVRGERQNKLHQSRDANAQGSGLGVRGEDKVQTL